MKKKLKLDDAHLLGVRKDNSSTDFPKDFLAKVVISVMIRGRITKSMFSIWRKNLSSIKNTHPLEIYSKYLVNTTHIIADKDCFGSILAWTKLSELPQHAQIVDKYWIIDSLKHGILIDPTPYIIVQSISDIVYELKHKTIINHKLSNDVENISNQSKDLNTEDGYHPSNDLIIKLFQQLHEIYEATDDKYRAKVYKSILASIQQLPPITSSKQVKDMPGIGKSVLNKIDEILLTGKLEKLDNFKKDKKIMALVEISQIWGVGPKTAAFLVSLGLNSIERLRSNGRHLLHHQQLICLDHFEDFKIRIPNTEMIELEHVVKVVVNKLSPTAKCLACGSFRRGALTSGDIDILIGPPDATSPSKLLGAVIQELTTSGFLTAHLCMPHTSEEGHASSNDKSSYMGVCQLPSSDTGLRPPHRRIDIKVYCSDMFPYALLYFTGPDHFNRQMRFYAEQHFDIRLSDSGITPRSEHMNPLIFPVPAVKKERDIFDLLRLTYKQPWERDRTDAIQPLE